ncbi:MAG TPA: arginine deiminase family protein [Gaiellaceae bacterium]|nr:arginine deiminase family protein [Gaiellaceae bacterium]
MNEVAAQLFGGQTMVARLRRVLVRPPDPGSLAHWSQFAWRAAPDPGRLLAEHDEFCNILSEFGAEVIVGESPVDADPDAIYTHDPSLIADEGAIVLRPGKELRRAEVPAAAADLQAAGVPILASLDVPACAEGGDIVWLNEETLLVGWSYRTNGPGIAALKQHLPRVDVVALDLPHFRGAGEVLHLMSVISMLDRDLALVYPPLAPVRLLQLLSEHGVRTIEVPDDELDTLGPNVLALAPRVALAVEGNPRTRRRMEQAGVDVTLYAGAELSKGDGGPTCLTRPLLRTP